jgi:hypothetical protein
LRERAMHIKVLRAQRRRAKPKSFVNKGSAVKSRDPETRPITDYRGRGSSLPDPWLDAKYPGKITVTYDWVMKWKDVKPSQAMVVNDVKNGKMQEIDPAPPIARVILARIKAKELEQTKYSQKLVDYHTIVVDDNIRYTYRMFFNSNTFFFTKEDRLTWQAWHSATIEGRARAVSLYNRGLLHWIELP